MGAPLEEEEIVFRRTSCLSQWLSIGQVSRAHSHVCVCVCVCVEEGGLAINFYLSGWQLCVGAKDTDLIAWRAS